MFGADAYAKDGLTPDGHTWRHVEDGMMLVPTELHTFVQIVDPIRDQFFKRPEIHLS